MSSTKSSNDRVANKENLLPAAPCSNLNKEGSALTEANSHPRQVQDKSATSTKVKQPSVEGDSGESNGDKPEEKKWTLNDFDIGLMVVISPVGLFTIFLTDSR